MRKAFRTLSSRFLSLVILTTVLMLGLLLIANSFLISLTRQQVLQTRESVLQNYTTQLAATLQAIQNGLMGIYIADNTFDLMQYLPNGNERLIARTSINNRLLMLPTLYPVLDTVFIYSSYSEDYLNRTVGNYHFSERDAIQAASRLWIQETASAGISQWQYHSVGDQSLLVYVYHNGDAYVGGIINLGSLMEKLPFPISTTDDSMFFYQDDRLIFATADWSASSQLAPVSQYLKINSKKYLAAAAIIAKTDYKILSLTPETLLIYNPLSNYGLVTLLIGCSTLLFIAISVIMRRTFVRPVLHLVRTMNKVSEGDLQTRVDLDDYQKIEDYRIIGEAFNRSMDQSQLLTKKIYEKELDEQKLHLRNLQMQITPHFVVNTLNMIYSASVARKNDIVEEMCTYLSRYFHYFTEANRELVQLQEEANYTENFLHIQEHRFNNRFEYDIQIPAYLQKALIPTMVLKTFAENSIKYAVSPKKYTRLTIAARMISLEKSALLELSIADNGPGYPAEMIRSLTEQGTPGYDTSQHTGIWNMMERMKLLYGEQARITFSDREGGGAYTQIVLPLNIEQGEEKIVSNSAVG